MSPSAFRLQFPELAQASDAELAPSLAEASTVYQGGDAVLLGYLAAHLHCLRSMEASGDLPEPGYQSTSYGRHYQWRLRRAAEPTAGC